MKLLIFFTFALGYIELHWVQTELRLVHLFILRKAQDTQQNLTLSARYILRKFDEETFQSLLFRNNLEK